MITIKNLEDKKIDDCTKRWTLADKIKAIIRRNLTEVMLVLLHCNCALTYCYE